MTIIRIWYVLWKRCLSVDQTWLLFAFSGCSVSAWPNPCHRLSLQNVFCLPRAETWPQTGVECVCHFAHFAGDWWGWGGLPSQITGCCPKSAAHCRMAPGRKIRRAAEYTRHPWCFINGCWYQPPLSISGSSVLGFQDLHKGIVVILICQKC